MSWIQTHSNKKIDLLNPDVKNFNTGDISYALAKQARYNGNTIRFFSVAEHICNGVEYMAAGNKYTWEDIRCWLLHDASEAYIGDIPTPIKRILGDAWYNFEREFEGKIYERFNSIPSDKNIKAVKEVDYIMLKSEKDVLFTEFPEPWDCDLEGIKRDEATSNRIMLGTSTFYYWESKLNDLFRRYDIV